MVLPSSTRASPPLLLGEESTTTVHTHHHSVGEVFGITVTTTDYQSWLEDEDSHQQPLHVEHSKKTPLQAETMNFNHQPESSFNTNYNKKESSRDEELKPSLSSTHVSASANNVRSFWFIFFWLCALLTHLIMSTNQVISRYLLHYGGKQMAIQPYTLLCLSNLGALLLYTPRMLYKYGRVSAIEKVKWNIRQAGGFGKLLYRHRKVIGMMCLYQISIVLGSSLREFATFFTSSTYVQLILLTSPFIICFMGIVVFKTERFSWLDLWTLIFTVTGAVMIILASATRVTEDANGNPVEFQWKW
ncbi:hypothetical protein FDP41_004877 [Naegleria fowleri]|uniref:Uncharacterized protein n=1 Tax=Naegleria fowleri TaxID=5763 RepID=A0A6A5BMU5_NAEFO|nr:uncharacterized protein FDP41_004877 [Naegleria fowleri]KAF0976202.1 hypothetical protein FDP41_004877 [Naegleria fowleri]